jgi:hypothetical protein
MNSTLKVLAISLVALIGLARNPTAYAQQRSPDGQGLDQLARSGSDLTQLHQVDFRLRFPTLKAAERAELQLIGLAFATRIEHGKTPEERVVLAAKKMFPVESDLMGLRDKLDAIAAAGRGVYEGWRAKRFEREASDAVHDPRIGYWIENAKSPAYTQGVGLHMSYENGSSGAIRVKFNANRSPANLQAVEVRCDGSKHPVMSGTGSLVGRTYSCRIAGPRTTEALITRANTDPVVTTTLVEVISEDGIAMTGTWTDRDPAGKVLAEGQRYFSRR